MLPTAASRAAVRNHTEAPPLGNTPYTKCELRQRTNSALTFIKTANSGEVSTHSILPSYCRVHGCTNRYCKCRSVIRRSEGKAANKATRTEKAKKAACAKKQAHGPVTPVPVRVHPRVRFQLWIPPQGFCVLQLAPSFPSTTPRLHLLSYSLKRTQNMNPSYMLLPPTENTASAPLQLN